MTAAEKSKKRRAMRRKKGLCINCGRPAPDRARCDKCQPAYAAAKYRSAAAARAIRRAAKKCIDCGRKSGGKLRCIVCAEKYNAQQRLRYQARNE